MALPTIMTTTTQLLSITTSLLAAGSLTTTSLIEIPQLRSQPASRSLPMLRWYFSRGSHIFPPAAILSSTGFLYLAYTAAAAALAATPALGASTTSTLVFTLLKTALTERKVQGYLAAAALNLSIAPFTALVMVPAVNFQLIQRTIDLGGARSAKAAEAGGGQPGRSAEDSANSRGEGASQWGDVSGPASVARREGSKREEERVGVLLERFGKLNLVRAGLMGVGGVVGLGTALAL